jgi:hypothetical protein
MWPLPIICSVKRRFSVRGANTVETDVAPQRNLPSERTSFLPIPTQERKPLDFAFYVSEHVISSSSTQFTVTRRPDKARPVYDRVRCGTRNRQETQTSCPSQLEHRFCHCLDAFAYSFLVWLCIFTRGNLTRALRTLREGGLLCQAVSAISFRDSIAPGPPRRAAAHRELRSTFLYT